MVPTFFKATLTNVQFVNTALRGTNFEEAKLYNVDARNAIFAPNVNFGPANLFKATLENVNLSGANLRQISITKVGSTQIGDSDVAIGIDKGTKISTRQNQIFCIKIA